MKLFSMYWFCDKELSGRPPEAICEAIGIARDSYNKWASKLSPFFEEWLEERRIELGGKNKRAALEAVGMQEALKGEFNFWKPLAIREGVISPDKLEIGASLPASLEAYKEMSPNDLKALENSVLASLRGEGESNPGEITLVEGPEGWGQEGDPGGATEVPGSVVLAGELGADRERALSELESF